MPERIQRQRAKGWKKPAGAVIVTRPTVWGNPFVGPHAITTYRKWLAGKVYQFWCQDWRQEVLERLPELRGKDLCCYCKPGAACHADVLLELANQREPCPTAPATS